MKRLAAIFAMLLVCALGAWAQQPSPFLPDSFGGWTRAQIEQKTDAAAADPVYSDLLKEYGFTSFDSAVYTRPDRKITVRAIKFNDASGAYGAFTFYKEPEMVTEKIGDQGASANQRVLFYRGNILVDVRMDRITAMTAGELRDLAAGLPEAKGPAKNLPTVPTYLPKQWYLANSAKYVMGPIGLSAVSAPVRADLLGFGNGAEAVVGRYSTAEGTATMMIVSYPTPAIAGERQRAIEAATKNMSTSAAPVSSGPLTVKRTGPMLAFVAGQVSSSEAKSLLGAVNYDADVTWNERANLSPKDNVANLLFNEAVLVFIVVGFALVFGIAFGGVRLLMKKLFPGKVFDRPQDIEIIQLNIREERPVESSRRA